jgi:hypothetical protein
MAVQNQPTCLTETTVPRIEGGSVNPTFTESEQAKLVNTRPSFIDSVAYFRHTKYNDADWRAPASKSDDCQENKAGRHEHSRLDSRVRNAKPATGTNGPLIPGDPEREAEAIRSKEGIPLIKPVVDDLLDISRKTGIPFEVKR